MTSFEFADEVRTKITDETTHGSDYYGLNTDMQSTSGTSHISIVAENGDALAATTTVNHLLVQVYILLLLVIFQNSI